ncbi:cytochrome P450 [Streptomyces malaysiensis]|uniref:Cytochrome P450 n=1 Tax=Streptomyces malaysiensis TaxID=92644 RepID=A0A7X6AW60_STRMQ|nr:cytochrome P450 [Streptomyces malaysiensis]NIY63577.1 cytochrome P450 [Streptomyces malaysiensis]
MDRTDEIRDYPELRAAACPFSPPPGYEELRERSAVTRVRMWDGSTPFLVTGYHEARAVLGDSRFSADGTHKGMPRFTKFEVPAEVFNLGRMDDPEHARIRRMLTAHFTIRRTEAMRPMIQGIVDGLLDRLIAEGPPADLVADFAFPLPSQVIAVMLGVSDADFAEFQRASQGVMDFTVSTEEMGAALGVMVDYVSRMCAAKRAAPGDDLLSRLIVDQELTGGLTQQQVVATALVLLLAGHETTANMIALSSVLLLRHPEQLARLRADPGLMPNAVDELLRYITIVQEGTGRVAAEDVEVGGVLIPAGEGVIINLPSANRDPHFADAHELDLGRPNAREHIGFGFGVHQCLGQTLARVELQIALETLLRRLPALRLEVPLDDLAFLYESMNFGVARVPVAW